MLPKKSASQSRWVECNLWYEAEYLFRFGVSRDSVLIIDRRRAWPR